MSRLMLPVLLLLGLAPIALAADPPALVNYQGVLRDEAGQPRDGAFDMVFRFMSAEASGTEIMVDSHTAAGGNAVTVSGGLFNLQLGGGTVTDGSGAGTYTSLANVFRDYGTVWLAIRVGGEDLSPLVRVVSAAYALNAANAVNAVNASQLNGAPSSTYLDTSSTAQTKTGQLTIESGSSYGINSRGATAGGYFRDSTSSGYAYLGIGDTGIEARGNTRGGYFVDDDGSGYAYAAYGDNGIWAQGNTAGGYFKDRDGSGFAYVGHGDSGIDAEGSTAGGHFSDSDGPAYAWAGYGTFGIYAGANGAGGFFQDLDSSGAASVGVGDTGISASGNEQGGHFEDPDSSGSASVAIGDTGISASGNEQGGYFQDLDSSGMARIAYGAYGAYAEGSTAGGWFKDTDGSGLAYLGYNDEGIHASGTSSGGHFLDSGASGYAYVGYGNEGIHAGGSSAGGRFYDTDQSGYAYIGYGDYGIMGNGNNAGGSFGDTNESTWANVAERTYKILGSGTVSFVQNHPTERDKVVVYAAPEGDEVAVYTRGTARLVDGEARVALGPTFQWVANPEIGLTAHLTPRGAWSDLYVAALSTKELVVRGEDGGKDAVFDYIVYGLRIGFEESSIVQPKQREAYIPSMRSHQGIYASSPDLRAFTALERFRTMSAAAGLAVPVDLPATATLKAAIHEYDPATDAPAVQRDDEEVRPEHPATPVDAAALNPDRARKGSATVGEGGAAAAVVPRTLLPVSEPVDTGDLLVLDPLRAGALVRSRTQAEPVVAVAAALPADVNGTLQVPICDTIYARVKADASIGAIQVGDQLIASGLAGHAMKAPEGAPAGSIVGTALEALETGQGLVLVRVR